MKLKTLHEDQPRHPFARREVLALLEKYLLDNTKDLSLKSGWSYAGFKLEGADKERNILLGADKDGRTFLTAWDSGVCTTYLDTNFHDPDSFPEILTFVRKHLGHL